MKQIRSGIEPTLVEADVRFDGKSNFTYTAADDTWAEIRRTAIIPARSVQARSFRL